MKEHSSQKRAKILTVLFVVMLLLPAPLWLLLAPHLDTTNYENRTLAAFPQDTGVEEWPGAFEDWLNDHAPFRNQFMSLNGRLNWALGTLDSSDVLLGKEHWLFLKDVSDSKSISDYQGLTAYSEEELADFVNTLSTLRDRLAEHGTKMVVVIAPAKEGVYSQYMPDSIPVVSRPTRVQTLAERLSAADIPLVWPQQDLIDASAGQQVYYKYDTHWNETGAYLAVTQAEAFWAIPSRRWRTALSPSPRNRRHPPTWRTSAPCGRYAGTIPITAWMHPAPSRSAAPRTATGCAGREPVTKACSCSGTASAR